MSVRTLVPYEKHFLKALVSFPESHLTVEVNDHLDMLTISEREQGNESHLTLVGLPWEREPRV
jgi:hypothetical protein